MVLRIVSTPAVHDFPLPPALRRYRRFPLDGGLLCFDRDSGWNVLFEGEETAHFAMVAPRAVQFAITNGCNLACTFCSRDLDAASEWTAASAFSMLADLAAAGVLEVAFGGGEPLAFRGFDRLVQRLPAETPLAVSFTTNGLLFDRARIARLAGCCGQIRLSLYDDNDWRETVRRLVDGGARFGVNLLITPERSECFADTVLELAALGCRDVLLLSYNGRDRSMHLVGDRAARVAATVANLARALRGRVGLKLDVCWGERMQAVPRILAGDDCGAGRDTVVLTSDRRLSPCSFHHFSVPAPTAAAVLRAWREQRAHLRSPARDPGCARAPQFGLGATST